MPPHTPPPAPESAIPDAFVPVRWRLGERGPTHSRYYVLAHLKGGSGKSTGAGTLALRLAEHTGQDVLAIDLDTRSQTLTQWHRTLGDRWPANVRFETWPVADLEDRIGAVIGGPTPPAHFVLDSGGHDTALLMAAVKAGRFPRHVPGLSTVVRGADVIMPLTPSDAEVVPVTTTFDVVSACARVTPIRFRAVMTRVGPAGTADQDFVRATTALGAAGIPWTDTYISYLKKHLRAVGQYPQPVRNPDRPRDDDAGQFDALLAELLADDPVEVISA